MSYLKVILSLCGSVFLASAIGAWPVLSHMGERTAVGVDALLVMGFSSLWFWPLALLFFGLFLLASRVGNNILVKISLFWIPTVLLSVLGLPFVALITYALLRARP